MTNLRAQALGIVILVLATCVGCAGTGTRDLLPESQQQVRDEVSRTAQELSDQMRARGPAAWMDFLADREDFYLAAHGGILFPDRASTNAFVEQFAPTIRSMDLRWTNERILVLDADRALFSADWTEEVIPVQGPSLHMAGYFSGLVERMDEGWRFRTMHWSDLPPPDSSP